MDPGWFEEELRLLTEAENLDLEQPWDANMENIMLGNFNFDHSPAPLDTGNPDVFHGGGNQGSMEIDSDAFFPASNLEMLGTAFSQPQEYVETPAWMASSPSIAFTPIDLASNIPLQPGDPILPTPLPHEEDLLLPELTGRIADPRKWNWTYSIDVGSFDVGDSLTDEQQRLYFDRIKGELGRAGSPDFGLLHFAARQGGDVRLWRFLLPKRVRDLERSRLKFMQVFNISRPWNRALPGYHFIMNISFDDETPTTAESYVTGSETGLQPAVVDGVKSDSGPDVAPDAVRFSPGGDIANLANYNTVTEPCLTHSRGQSAVLEQPGNTRQGTDMEQSLTMASSSQPKTANTDNPARTKAIPKPERDAAKNAEGQYVCVFPGCNEAVTTFRQKCQWDKHMDKHERPYKCPHQGCEKIQGFTYSGGLLRHMREVHHENGGPKNALNCPHVNCKRARGKGFTRLENLNEHLRRCHTEVDPKATSGSGVGAADDTSPAATPADSASNNAPERAAVTGEKRKAEDDLRGEVKRLREENEASVTEKQQLQSQVESQKLRIEAQNRQSVAMMAQIQQLENTIEDLQTSRVATSVPPAALLENAVADPF